MTLEDRIVALERRERRYRFAFIALGLVLISIVVMGATSKVPTEIRARKFIAVDANGRDRVRIGAEGFPEISLLTEKGSGVINIQSVFDSAWISVQSATEDKSQPKVQSFLTASGFSLSAIQPAHFKTKDDTSYDLPVSMNLVSLNAVTGKDGKTLGRVQVWGRTIDSKNGETSEFENERTRIPTIQMVGFPSSGKLFFNDGNQKSRMSLGVVENGVAYLETYNLEKDKPLVQIGSGETGGLVQVFNKTGESIVTLVPDEYGNGRIGAWNRQGRGHTLQPGP